MGRRRKVLDPAPVSETSLIHQLSAKIENMENELKASRTQVELVEKNQKKAGIGSQTYGMSDWRPWQSGSEKGYHRTLYVDVSTMIMPRAY